MSRNGYKQKVCIIVNHENTILLFRKELITVLIERGHDVSVMLPAQCEKAGIEALGATIVDYDLAQFGTNPINEIRSIKSISHQLSEIKPDIVLTYTIKPNLYGGFVCKRKKIPYVATVTGLGRGFEQNSAIDIILSNGLKYSLKKAKKVVFQNEPTMEFFAPKYIEPERCLLVNGSGVDLSANPMEPYPNNEHIEILFVGRITGDKGINELIKAVLAINNSGTEIHLTLVGPVEKDCEELVAGLRDNSLFRFEGMKKQSEVHSFIKKCDVVVVPSYHEGMCNSLLEAAATGRPVITTRIPGCQETFNEGESGLGCDPRDESSLQKVILRFAHMDVSERRQMGINGRLKMEKEFDRLAIIQQYIGIIEKI